MSTQWSLAVLFPDIPSQKHLPQDFSATTLRFSRIRRARSCIFSLSESKSHGVERRRARSRYENPDTQLLRSGGKFLHRSDYLIQDVVCVCDAPSLCDRAQLLTGQAHDPVVKGECMLCAPGDVRHQVKRRRQPITGRCGQHPEVLQMIVDVSDRRVECHVSKQVHSLLDGSPPQPGLLRAPTTRAHSSNSRLPASRELDC
jgi:hypothetical protein